MSLEQNRLRSFDVGTGVWHADWPEPALLAEAGFFISPTEDDELRCITFCCGGALQVAAIVARKATANGSGGLDSNGGGHGNVTVIVVATARSRQQ